MKNFHSDHKVLVLLVMIAAFARPSAAESPVPRDAEVYLDVPSRCVGAGDCACGSTCIESFCIARSVPDNCEQDADCVACTGRVCARGRCLRPTASPTCAGQVCTGCDVCVDRIGCTQPIELNCANPAECGPGADCVVVRAGVQRCERRAAVAVCMNDSDCLPCAGSFCERSRCFTPLPGRRCQSNTTCVAFGCQICLPRVGCQDPSLVRCSVDLDCGEGLRCDRATTTCRQHRAGDSCSRPGECAACDVRLTCDNGTCAAIAMDGGVIVPDGGFPRVNSGCACRAASKDTSATASPLLMLALGLATLARRRSLSK